MQDAAKPLPYGNSEILLTKEQLVDFERTGLYRIKSCPIAYACRLYEVKTIGKAPQTLIFGEILSVYIDDACINHKTKRLEINPELISPLGRLGAGQFADISNIRCAN